MRTRGNCPRNDSDYESIIQGEEFNLPHFKLKIHTETKRPKSFQLRIIRDKLVEQVQSKNPDVADGNGFRLKIAREEIENVEIMTSTQNMILETNRNGLIVPVLTLVKTQDKVFYLNYRYPMDMLSAFGVSVCRLLTQS